MFFEVYINFKIVHCGVIPVQSFGSHIRPQPHGLGLRMSFMHMCGYPPAPGPGEGASDSHAISKHAQNGKDLSTVLYKTHG